MPVRKSPIPGPGNRGAAEEYAQVFLYRVPKANHEAFASTEGKLATIFRRCGILRSDFFVLGDGRVFKGFRDLREVLAATPEEEVWVEIDTYLDAADSVRVIAEIVKDPAAAPLFGQILWLATPGVLCPQGNAERMHP